MNIKLSITILLIAFSISCIAKAEGVDQKMLQDCVTLAEIMNKSSKVNININELTPLYTWRASCSDKPPAGTGNVMALCEGTSVRSDGTAELMFFWSKTNRGTFTTGHNSCKK